MKVALFEPELPPNVGAIIRTCACFNVPLIIIEPMGFVMQNKNFRRSKMDYNTNIEFMDSMDDFLVKYKNVRKILLSPHCNLSIKYFNILSSDILIFGRESSGVDLEYTQQCDAVVKIPIDPRCRSFNLAASVAMTLAIYNI